MVALASDATTVDATPELRNSPKLATPERVKTDPFNGTAAYAYKIDVPPGTAGVTPELTLTYSTQSQHSEYGYGWSLNLPYIERSTREHRPYYNDPANATPLDDEFELAGDLLVRDGTSNRFHLRYADGSRILWDAANARWEVTRPDGAKALYGSTSSSRIFRNADTPAETFRWALTEVIDPRGNSYRIQYKLDMDSAGVGTTAIWYRTYVYPERITYTHTTQSGAAPLQDHRAIEFEWEERANAGESNTGNGICDGKEDCPTSYRAGFKVQRRYRLARIAVGIDSTTDGLDPGEEVRSYAFLYANKTSQNTQQNLELGRNPPFSQLAAIQRYGRGGLAFPSTSTPVATEFGYSRPPRKFLDDEGQWSGASGLIMAGEGSSSSSSVRKHLIDMNGDGVLDRLELVGNDAQHSWEVYFGKVDENGPLGFASNPIIWTFDCGNGTASMCTAARSERLLRGFDYKQISDLADMDGDLLPDRVVGGAHKALTVFRNHGSGFGAAETWSLPNVDTPYDTYAVETASPFSHLNQPMRRLLADINGDGRPEYHSPGPGFIENVGSGFGQTLGAAMDNLDGGYNLSTLPSSPGRWNHLADVNGDGILDHIPYRMCFGSPNDYAQFGLSYGMGGARWQHKAGQGHEYDPGDEANCPDNPHPNTWRYPESRGDGQDIIGALIDMNGDGWRDYVYAVSRGGGVLGWTVYFGLGDGRYLMTSPSGGPMDWGAGVQIPDGALWDMSNIPACFISAADHAVGIDVPGESTIRTIDLDGDGLVDHVRTGVGDPYPTECSEDWSVYRNPGAEGLLESVTNELGGVTTIAYTPSTWMTSLTEEPEAGGLPSDIVGDGRPRWVVTSVAVSDGRTGTAIESEALAYAGFRFDMQRRETFGVRMAENENATGLVTRSLFHQHPEKRGKLERQSKCQGSACLETVETEWSLLDEPVPDKAFLVRPTKTTTRLCDPMPATDCDESSDGQVRVVESEFDVDSGLPLKETDYGPDASLVASADNLVHVFTYAKNTTEWIVSTVASEKTYFGSEQPANLVSETRLYYDSAGFGGGTVPQRCTGGSGLCGALITFRETLRDKAADTWAVEQWTYDAFGNMATYKDPKTLMGGGAPTQTVTYDTSGYNSFPLAIANALGHTSHFRFDPELGEVTRALSPGGHLRCFSYDDPFGRFAARSESSSAVLPQAIESAACNTPLAAFDYHDTLLGDAEAQHITETAYAGGSAASIQSLRYFDGLGREYQNETLHRASDGTFDVVSRAWGARGELTCETLPFRRTGGVTGGSPVACDSQTPRRATAYDALLRPTQVARIEPGGGTVVEATSQYAINGFSLSASIGDLRVEQRTTIGGPGGLGQDPTPNRVQLFGLDNRGQVVVLREGSDPDTTTRLARDPKGRITQVDGPDVALASGGADANLLEIAYNAADQRTRLAQPLSPDEPNAPRWLFAYDGNGDLYEQTSPRNVTIRYHRDALRRLALEDYGPSYSSSPSAPGSGDVVHEYYTQGFGIGQLETVYGRHGIATDFAYDLRGRVGSKSRDYGGSMQFVFTYVYDRLDRPTFTVLPDTSTITQSYDGSAPSYVTTSVPLAAGGAPVADMMAYGIETHPSGGLTSLTVSPPALSKPPVASTWSYGAGDHRLASATTVRDPSGTAELIQQQLYSYDTAGNLRRSDDGLNQLDQFFEYDPLHRLAEIESAGSAAYGTHGYSYDAAGNLLYRGPAGATGELGLVYDRSATTPTHLAAIDERVAGSTWTPDVGLYTVNADGGVTARTKGSQLLTLWRNAEGWAQVVTDHAAPKTATYHYDPSGERSEKLVTGIFGVVLDARYYVDASFEVDTLNNTHEVHLFVGSRRVATSKRNGLGNTATASIASVTTYHGDQVGTNSVTVTSTAASPQAVSRTYLDPFGEKKSGTGTEPRYLFTDQERDAESGLDYFGARFYDAWAGRFIEQDPELGGAAAGVTFEGISSDAGNLNGYAYVLGRPTTAVDPTGRFVEWSQGNSSYFFTMQAAVDAGLVTATVAGTNAAGENVTVTVPLNSFTQAQQNQMWQATEGGTKTATAFQVTGSSNAATSSSQSGSSTSDAGGVRSDPAQNPFGTLETPAGVDINRNIEEARGKDILWFRDQVRNGGPWDYKQQGPQYQNFGNYNYGATGKALGLSERLLLREAGRAQQAAGTSLPEWGDPGSRLNPAGGTGSYGDDPVDQFWIGQGFNYYDSYNSRK
jgi:RHS repeat-associated protein